MERRTLGDLEIEDALVNTRKYKWKLHGLVSGYGGRGSGSLKTAYLKDGSKFHRENLLKVLGLEVA